MVVTDMLQRSSNTSASAIGSTGLKQVASTPPLELWGGVEATVNRIGDLWMDQLHASGHNDRPGDLDHFAAIGIRALRHPIIWERTEVTPGVFDWSWPDLWMDRLRKLGLRPIVGLVHHGSGPAWANIGTDFFAPGLAAFATEVARRYPWVQDWTPINEPVTTARFSGLYGHWHPHLTSERDFWRLLLNQIDATRLSMRAIRQMNPNARLIQTDDFGHTYATPPCQEQADYDNRRRLAGWDLLFGKVVSGHPLWSRLSSLGFQKRLEAIAADPCPADVIGMNYYVTSDRYLDHGLLRYPQNVWGGNGKISYADVEAVRVVEGAKTWSRHVDALWSRYKRPIAITECHLGCECPHEQVQWFVECWTEALAARKRGLNVIGVTAWALVGSTGWSTLLTKPNGQRESGVFKPTSDGLMRTPLAGVLESAARNEPFEPAITPGWWRMPSRFLFGPPVQCEADFEARGRESRPVVRSRGAI